MSNKYKNVALGDYKRRLIVNYLPQLLTDDEFHYIFNAFGHIESARVIRDRITGYSNGYGFITFYNSDDAAKALENVNGLIVQDKRLKVSYARPPGEDRKDTNLYITNLPLTFTPQDLENEFKIYGNIVQYNLLRDKKSGMPRGVAFVRYERKWEAYQAMKSLNGVILKGGIGPLAIKVAEDHSTNQTFFRSGLQWNLKLQSAKTEIRVYKPWSSYNSRVSNPNYSCCEWNSKEVLEFQSTHFGVYATIIEIYCTNCKVCSYLRVKSELRHLEQWLQPNRETLPVEGWRCAVTVDDFAIVYIFSQLFYNKTAGSDEPIFDLPDSTDSVKIYWKNGRAVAYYTVKPIGSLIVSRNVCYSFNTLDTAYVLPDFRRQGLGVSMLLDMCKDCPGADLALSSPISRAMDHVVRKFLSMKPSYKFKLWEVDGCGGQGDRKLIFYSLLNKIS